VTARSTRCHVLVSGPPSRRPDAAGEIRAFSTCRNERLRLPAFLRHYRSLGVDRFFVIDHDSTDGTTDYLIGQPDVHLFRTANRYSDSRSGTDWLHALLMEFGVGGWCLTVDIDELLVYPGSERAPLQKLTEYFDRQGYQALSCLLLEQYPSGPLRDCAYQPGGDLIAAAPFFDAGPYHRSPVDSSPGVLIRGGVRERIFFPGFRTRSVVSKIGAGLAYHAARRMPFLHDLSWIRERRRGYPPCLTKVPLVRWDKQTAYVYSTHFVSRKVVAPDTGVLLHFKFLQDFHDRAIQEAARGEHYDEAFEYRRYAEELDRNPSMTFMGDTSTRFEGTTELVRLGLVQESEAWLNARSE
jgi:hypothetical protein